jgi:DNA (cytosine-5)-methyltransferase 1
MAAYYNEHDPKAAAWLRELIKAGHIAPGEVDERSIEDVVPNELNGFTQCHFFAGIGVWSYALRLAGWPDDRPVWTGSCPCQPFSAAGKRGGTADERHLWPAFQFLIEQCRPAIVLGEQVASKDGLAWLGTVHADLEASGYAVGAADLCAPGIGAPHIRQGLWFVGKRLEHAKGDGRGERRAEPSERSVECGCGDGGLADTHGERRDGEQVRLQSGEPRPASLETAGHGGNSRVADAGSEGRREVAGSTSGDEAANGRAGRDRLEPNGDHIASGDGADGRPCPTNGHWRAADWLHCRDGKWRPVEPGTFPLAHGASERVGRLRGYGNAVVAQAAQAFIESVM